MDSQVELQCARTPPWYRSNRQGRHGKKQLPKITQTHQKAIRGAERARFWRTAKRACACEPIGSHILLWASEREDSIGAM